MNTDAKIKEKQTLSDLELDFYSKRDLPDYRYFWTAARGTVLKILKDAKRKKPPATLFLPLHYPFFDDEVQEVLMQRHPEHGQIKSDALYWYAVEAYLITEQYALNYYSNDGLKNLDLIEGSAQDYFVIDLPWFSRLMVAVANAVGQKRGGVESAPTIAAMLQAWNNQYSLVDTQPSRWLAGTATLQKLKKQFRSPLNSVRVSANTENKKRIAVFRSWQMCWQSELDRLNDLLRNTSVKP